MLARQLADGPMVAPRVENVGWQGGEPTRQVCPARDSLLVLQVAILITVQDDLFYLE